MPFQELSFRAGMDLEEMAIKHLGNASELHLIL